MELIIINKYSLTRDENISLVNKNLVKIIYNSAKLEGLNVTFHKTKAILEGVNLLSVKLDDMTCILNLRDAWKYVLNSLDTKLDLDYICYINSFVLRNESLKWGVLRDGKVGISGTNYIPKIPVKDEVTNELSKLCK